MHKSGIANLPLHGGNCPRWLFPRMKKLGGAISEIIINEYGTEEFLRRLANPYFLQSLGCAIGFDWHSSGLTTTTLSALKESLNKNNLGIKIAGGKGKASKNTLKEIEQYNFSLSESKIARLKYSSRMCAKVDSVLIQDGYELYHHCFILSEKGKWTVIQQGMNSATKYARRYHWLSENFADFVDEPQNAICCDKKGFTLDLTSKSSKTAREVSLDLAKDNPNHLKKYFVKKFLNPPQQKTLFDFTGGRTLELSMPSNHGIMDMNKRNLETLRIAYEYQPKTYEELVAFKGVGAKIIRSLALISELVYGCGLSWKDPCRFSFALGGKDKIPYEINRKDYDEAVVILRNAVDCAKIGEDDKLNAIKRMEGLYVNC